MNIRYPHFMGGSQKCTQGTPLVKARNGKKLKMLNLKFAWISDPAANSRQTAMLEHQQFHMDGVLRASDYDVPGIVPHKKGKFYV